MLTINEIKNAVEQIAPEYPVKQVQLFGSYAEGFAHDKSDVDIFVEFSKWPVSLWEYCGFQQALSESLNIKVDMLKYPLSNEAANKIEFKQMVRLYG